MTVGWKTHNLSGYKPKAFIGLVQNGIDEHYRSGQDFLYFDNAYFKRGGNRFRLIRKGFHLQRILDRPDDRWRALEIPIHPWRKTGRDVVVIPPSAYHVELAGDRNWLNRTVKRLGEITDRPIKVKHGKGDLPAYLKDTWAVVTFASVAGVEALVMGIPVFSGPLCPTLPVSAGPIENIEKPEYLDREPLLYGLAYASWDTEELFGGKIQLEDYEYQCA